MWCLSVLLQTADWGSASGRQDGKQPPNEYTVTEAVDYIGSVLAEQSKALCMHRQFRHLAFST